MSNIDDNYIDRILNDFIHLEREAFNKLNSPPTKHSTLYKTDKLYAEQAKLSNTIKTSLVKLKKLITKIQEVEKQK